MISFSDSAVAGESLLQDDLVNLPESCQDRKRQVGRVLVVF